MRHLLLATPFALLATPAAASTGEPVNPWVALAYLISGVFFILALRGLSSPATSRTGNRFGMVGMLIAVVTTLVTHFPVDWNSGCPDELQIVQSGDSTFAVLCEDRKSVV